MKQGDGASTRLFPIKIPTKVTERMPLYIHTSAQSNPRMVKKGETVTLDTYFNSFSYKKYLTYTNVEQACAVLELTGQWRIELLAYTKAGGNRLLAVQSFSEPGEKKVEIPFDFSHETEDGFYWFRLTALSDHCMLLGGEYITSAPREKVKVAAVICTYHREKYILENIEQIQQELLIGAESSLRGKLYVLIIDNGQSLKDCLVKDSAVRLIYNKNCGGSAGFSRGIMEALSQENITHILLMDDDIQLDPGVLVKTITFLEHLKPEHRKLHVAGGMLFFDKPTVQHEATARWDGIEHSLKHGLDLDEPEQLWKNELDEPADYAAWWYLCIPKCCVGLDNLPLPLFIKCDDIEYGLRNMDECLVMNGIGVWHESFDKKFSTILDYYSIRNELVLNGLYKARHTVGALWLILKPCLRAIAYGLSTSVFYVDMAVEDYLQGTEFFLHTDGEEKNARLRALPPQSYVFPKHSNGRRIWSIVRKIPTLDFWKIMLRYFAIAVRYLRGRKAADRQYQRDWRRLATKAFWDGQLGLDG